MLRDVHPGKLRDLPRIAQQFEIRQKEPDGWDSARFWSWF
jgi:hypothetical protein